MAGPNHFCKINLRSCLIKQTLSWNPRNKTLILNMIGTWTSLNTKIRSTPTPQLQICLETQFPTSKNQPYSHFSATAWRRALLRSKTTKNGRWTLCIQKYKFHRCQTSAPSQFCTKGRTLKTIFLRSISNQTIKVMPKNSKFKIPLIIPKNQRTKVNTLILIWNL